MELMSTEEKTASETSAEVESGAAWRHLLRLHFVALLAVIVFFGAIRWRLLDLPLERDEGEYAYAGQLILQGNPPYQLAYNMKLPGTYAAYAAIMAVFGETVRGIHLGLVLVNALSVILIYLIAARLFGALAGTVAGTSFALLSTHQGVLGFAAHATHFVVLAALIGLALLLRAEDTGRTSYFFWSGLAFGIAFLMKQPGILLGAFAFFYLAIQCWPRSTREWNTWARKMSVFLLAAASPFALTCALLYRAGVFQNFWFWTFAYAREYAATTPLRVGLANLAANSSDMLHSAPWLWVFALLGIPAVFWGPDVTMNVRRKGLFIFGLLAFSVAAVCPGLYFREHYFILILPAVALLISVAVTSAARLLKTMFNSRWLGALPVIAFATGVGLAILHNADVYFKLTPQQACRLFYFPNPFPEAEPVAEYLRQHTAPTDKIMVLGSEPEIYFYAHRHSASGYIYTYSLMENQPYWPVMQKQMRQEIEANRPAYLVFVNIPGSWHILPGSRQAAALGAWMDQYISGGFEEVGMVEVAYPESHFFWGDEAREHHQPGAEIRIFKRKG
ncbi:MAG: glycosyltransferase family 39 protein [Terriglobales bacterium]